MIGTKERLGLDFGILGPLRVSLDGSERPVAGEKLRGLLAVLLLEANRAVSVDRLVDALWGDEPPATARQSLHVHVGRLRKALGEGDGLEAPVARVEHGYVLRVEEGRLDAERFRRLVAAARDARRGQRAAEAADGYRAALALWRGEALEGVGLPAVEAARAELDALRLAAVEERIDVELELGHAAGLVGELEALVERHPLREGLRAQLMLALYATGRQADALAAYRDGRRALDAVGLEPGPRLRELEGAILRQDERLVTAPLPAAGVAHGPPGGDRRRRWLGVALAAASVLVAVAVALVARDDPPGAAPQAAPRAVPNSLVEIDPASNEVVTVTRVGSDPDGMAFTRDAAWITTGDRTVVRVDLETHETRALGGVPVAFGVAATLDGDVWVSSFEEPVVTLVAEDGRVVGGEGFVASGPFRVELPGSSEALAVGGGYLWVTSPDDSGGDDTVSRIDLRTRRVVSSVHVGSIPAFAAFGYGSLWVANYKGESVSVIRPGSPRPETIPVTGGPLGVATGAGAVWVVAFWTQELVRIDPETRRVVERIHVGEGPLAVTVGGGSVWVTNRDSKTISRIDPRTNRVTATIRLAAAPQRISFAHGRVWVTAQRCGSPVVPCPGRSQ